MLYKKSPVLRHSNDIKTGLLLRYFSENRNTQRLGLAGYILMRGTVHTQKEECHTNDT